MNVNNAVSRFHSLFVNGIRIDPTNPLLNDIFYYMLLAFLAFYPVTYLVAFITPHSIYTKSFTLFTVGGMTIWYSVPAILDTVVYGAIFYKIWHNNLKRGSRSGLVAFVAATLFAVSLATSIDVAFNPSPSLIRYKYCIYLNYAFSFLKRASLLAVLPLITTIARYAYMIFKNNLFYSLRSVLAGLVGGIIGFVVFGLSAVFSTGFVWGCTVGLIMRNGIAMGKDPITTPIFSFLAALGIPPFWHTFWEFFAFSTFAIFGSLLTYGIITKNENFLRTSVDCSMLGIIMLMMAAFNEVTVDASFIRLVASHVDFTPHIAHITINLNYVIGLLSSIVVAIILMATFAWFINFLLVYIRDIVRGVH